MQSVLHSSEFQSHAVSDLMNKHNEQKGEKHVQNRATVTDVSFLRPYFFYLLTVGVEVVYFHLITLRHTPQSVGLLWTRDRPVVETST
jgi:hypothetical protein